MLTKMIAFTGLTSPRRPWHPDLDRWQGPVHGHRYRRSSGMWRSLKYECDLVCNRELPHHGCWSPARDPTWGRRRYNRREFARGSCRGERRGAPSTPGDRMVRCMDATDYARMIVAMRRHASSARNRSVSLGNAADSDCCARIPRDARLKSERNHMRGTAAAGVASSVWARRPQPFPAYTTLRAREHVPSAHNPSSVHDLFPRGIPLIPT